MSDEYFRITTYYRCTPLDMQSDYTSYNHFSSAQLAQDYLLEAIEDEEVSRIILVVDVPGDPNHQIIEIWPEIMRANTLQQRERARWSKITQLFASNRVEIRLREKFP